MAMVQAASVTACVSQERATAIAAEGQLSGVESRDL
jgi:hypothetical protein